MKKPWLVWPALFMIGLVFGCTMSASVSSKPSEDRTYEPRIETVDSGYTASGAYWSVLRDTKTGVEVIHVESSLSSSIVIPLPKSESGEPNATNDPNRKSPEDVLRPVP